MQLTGWHNGNEMHNSWTHKLQLSGPTVYSIDISYTLDSASVYQKVNPKISAVSPHNNRRRSYWSFPLIKKMLQKTLYYAEAFVYLILFSCIKEDLYCQLYPFPQYKIPCQLRGNDQRLPSGFNFRLPTVWDAPPSVYEISMVYSLYRGLKLLTQIGTCHFNWTWDSNLHAKYASPEPFKFKLAITYCSNSTALIAWT